MKKRNIKTNNRGVFVCSMNVHLLLIFLYDYFLFQVECIIRRQPTWTKKRCRPDFLPHLLSYSHFLNYYYYFSSFLSSNFFFCVWLLIDWVIDCSVGFRSFYRLDCTRCLKHLLLIMSIFFSSISLAVTGGGGGARLNATWRSAQAFAVNICLI